MLTKKELQRIIEKAGETMVLNGDVSVNLVANELRVAAEHLLVLLYP